MLLRSTRFQWSSIVEDGVKRRRKMDAGVLLCRKVGRLVVIS
jgi:hypothetical protein